MRLLISVVAFILFLVLNAKAQEQDTLFLSSAIKKLRNSKNYTLKVADLMPADRYNYRPAKEEMSFGQQLLHLCSNLGWLSASYLSAGVNPVSGTDNKIQGKDSIRSVIAETYDFAISALSSFPTEQLADTVKFFAGPMNKLQVINLLSDHQTHHRGQLLVYLRLCGITPPEYIGW